VRTRKVGRQPLALQRFTGEELEALAHATRFTADALAVRAAAAVDSRIDRHAILAVVARRFGRELGAGLGVGRDALLALMIAVEPAGTIPLFVARYGARVSAFAA
jgi:hypothetical protein